MPLSVPPVPVVQPGFVNGGGGGGGARVKKRSDRAGWVGEGFHLPR